MKRHVATQQPRVSATASPAMRERSKWRALPLEQLFSVWHCARGGLTSKEAEELLGFKIHGQAYKGAAEAIENLLHGPVSLQGRVRCCNCGAMVNEIPCRLCGWQTERYRVINRGTV